MNLSYQIEDQMYQFEKYKDDHYEGPFSPIFKTFTVEYDKKLSTSVKNVLQTWKDKPFYCVNEDILYLFKISPAERDFFLRMLHSMAIFLQNATCTSFFDISIYKVHISEAPKFDYFNNQKLEDKDLFNSLTFTLKYHITSPPEKPEVSWF